MRITNNMLINNMTYNLNQTLQRLEKLQYESAGKKFRVPSDDPIGASKSLKFNTDISKVEQYLR
ncbi:MAG: flagellar hook-associated protein FlgL, partial [Tissierellia bacterium]|nr:flagellar hook-associated protein FlgL [Tissierellia bacterium]